MVAYDHIRCLTLFDPGFEIAENVTAGRTHSLILLGSGEVRAFGSRFQCNVLPAFSGIGAVAVAAGAWHSLILLDGGDVRTFGSNTSGQCNVPAVGIVASPRVSNTP